MTCYVYFPGSFKPPHAGHFSVLDRFIKMKKVHKIYIIVSKKERGWIDQETSYKVWQIYLEKLFKENPELHKKLVVVKSPDASPLITARRYAQSLVGRGKDGKKKRNELILIKSAKDAGNSRFDLFKNLLREGLDVKEFIIKKFKNMNSTNMREVISAGNKKDFLHFLPDGLTAKQKEDVWKLVKRGSEE